MTLFCFLYYFLLFIKSLDVGKVHYPDQSSCDAQDNLEGEIVKVQLRKDSKSIYKEDIDTDKRISHPSLSTFTSAKNSDVTITENFDSLNFAEEPAKHITENDDEKNSLDFNARFPFFSDPKYDFSLDKYKHFKSDSALCFIQKSNENLDRSCSDNNITTDLLPNNNLLRCSQLYKTTKPFQNSCYSDISSPLTNTGSAASNYLQNVEEMAQIIGDSAVNLNYEDDDDVFLSSSQIVSSNKIEDNLSENDTDDDLTYGTFKMKHKSSTDNTHSISAPRVFLNDSVDMSISDFKNSDKDPKENKNLDVPLQENLTLKIDNNISFTNSKEHIPLLEDATNEDVNSKFALSNYEKSSLDKEKNSACADTVKNYLSANVTNPTFDRAEKCISEIREPVNISPSFTHIQKNNSYPELKKVVPATRVVGASLKKNHKNNASSFVETGDYKHAFENLYISSLLNTRPVPKPRNLVKKQKDNKMSNIGLILRNSFRRKPEVKSFADKSKSDTASFYLPKEQTHHPVDPKFYSSFDFTFNSPIEKQQFDNEVDSASTQEPRRISDPVKVIENVRKDQFYIAKSDTNLSKDPRIENLLLLQCPKLNVHETYVTKSLPHEMGNELFCQRSSSDRFRKRKSSKRCTSPVLYDNSLLLQTDEVQENPETEFLSEYYNNLDKNFEQDELSSREAILHDLALLNEILNSDSDETNVAPYPNLKLNDDFSNSSEASSCVDDSSLLKPSDTSCFSDDESYLNKCSKENSGDSNFTELQVDCVKQFDIAENNDVNDSLSYSVGTVHDNLISTKFNSNFFTMHPYKSISAENSEFFNPDFSRVSVKNVISHFENVSTNSKVQFSRRRNSAPSGKILDFEFDLNAKKRPFKTESHNDLIVIDSETNYVKNFINANETKHTFRVKENNENINTSNLCSPNYKKQPKKKPNSYVYLNFDEGDSNEAISAKNVIKYHFADKDNYRNKVNYSQDYEDESFNRSVQNRISLLASRFCKSYFLLLRYVVLRKCLKWTGVFIHVGLQLIGFIVCLYFAIVKVKDYF